MKEKKINKLYSGLVEVEIFMSWHLSVYKNIFHFQIKKQRKYDD